SRDIGPGQHTNLQSQAFDLAHLPTAGSIWPGGCTGPAQRPPALRRSVSRRIFMARRGGSPAAVPCAALLAARVGRAADKKPNIVMLMTDDVGWNDFGAYSGGGAALGHPTPNIDRIAKEGAMFTSWYGQASCTAGRASFITGRIPIRSALSVVVA